MAKRKKGKKKNFSKLSKQHLAVCLAAMLHPVKWPPVRGTERKTARVCFLSAGLSSPKRRRFLAQGGALHNACQQHPTPCLSQPNSTRYAAPPAPLRNMLMCFACMPTTEPTNQLTWGEKKTEKPRLFFFPPSPAVFEKLEAADANVPPSFLPCALLRLLLPPLHVGTERVETPGSR